MTEKELLDVGYRKYTAEGMDIFFNKDICQHAGICVKGAPEVFNLERKPWILCTPDFEELTRETIDKCPSGALKYIVK